jgi:hypothetical protein
MRFLELLFKLTAFYYQTPPATRPSTAQSFVARQITQTLYLSISTRFAQEHISTASTLPAIVRQFQELNKAIHHTYNTTQRGSVFDPPT